MSATHRSGCSSVRIERRAGVVGHARRRRVDETVGCGRARRGGRRRRRRRRARPGTRRAPRPARSPRRRRAVARPRAPAPRARRRCRRRRRPTSTTSSRLRARQAAAEALGEARPVGVVADHAAVVEHDRVDRAERLGLARERVEMRDRELLARVGDVDAAQAAVARLGEQLADRLGRRVRARRGRAARSCTRRPSSLGLALVQRPGSAIRSMPAPIRPTRSVRGGWRPSALIDLTSTLPPSGGCQTRV